MNGVSGAGTFALLEGWLPLFLDVRLSSGVLMPASVTQHARQTPAIKGMAMFLDVLFTRDLSPCIPCL